MELYTDSIVEYENEVYEVASTKRDSEYIWIFQSDNSDNYKIVKINDLKVIGKTKGLFLVREDTP